MRSLPGLPGLVVRSSSSRPRQPGAVLAQIDGGHGDGGGIADGKRDGAGDGGGSGGRLSGELAPLVTAQASPALSMATPPRVPMLPAVPAVASVVPTPFKRETVPSGVAIDRRSSVDRQLHKQYPHPPHHLRNTLGHREQWRPQRTGRHCDRSARQSLDSEQRRQLRVRVQQRGHCPQHHGLYEQQRG